MQDIRTILRLTHEQGLSVREIGLRLKLSKTTVATYVNAGVNLGHVAAQNWATLDLRGAGMSGGGQSAALFM